MLEAIRKLYEDNDLYGVLYDIQNDVLTENKCRNGRSVIWYMNNEKCIAIYTDTLEYLSDAEIEKELC